MIGHDDKRSAYWLTPITLNIEVDLTMVLERTTHAANVSGAGFNLKT